MNRYEILEYVDLALPTRRLSRLDDYLVESYCFNEHPYDMIAPVESQTANICFFRCKYPWSLPRTAETKREDTQRATRREDKHRPKNAWRQGASNDGQAKPAKHIKVRALSYTRRWRVLHSPEGEKRVEPVLCAKSSHQSVGARETAEEPGARRIEGITSPIFECCSMPPKPESKRHRVHKKGPFA